MSVKHINFLFVLTALYLIYLICLLFILKSDWVWFFNIGFSDYKILYPRFYFFVYIALKIVPPLGVFILLSGHSLVLFLKAKLYKDAASNNKLIVFCTRYWIELLGGTCLLFMCTEMKNEAYCFALISSMVLFYLSFKFNLLKNKAYSVCFLVVIATAIRIVYLTQTGICDLRQDSLARIAQLYKWDLYGGLPGGLNWLPAYHWLVYFLSKLFFVSYESGGVIFSYLSSVGICVFGYLWIEKKFSKEIAVLSIGFFCLNPFFAQLSVVQMAEMPFVCFMMAGIYFATLYFERNKILYFLLTALFFNMANLMRFEGWIIVPLIALVYWQESRNLKKTFLLFSIAMLSALLFSLISFLVTGNPIKGVTASDIEVAEAMLMRGGDILNRAISMLFDPPWIPLYFIFLLFAGLFLAVLKNRQRYLAMILLVLTGYYAYKIMMGTLEPFWRYFSFVLIFSFPFAFLALRNKISYPVLLAFVFFIFPIWTVEKASNLIKGFTPLPSGFIESATFYKQRCTESDKIILSMNPYSDDDFWMAKAVNSKSRIQKFTRLYPGFIELSGQEHFTVQNMKKKIISEKFNWIVIEKTYELDSLFNDREMKEYLNTIKSTKNQFGNFTMIQLDHGRQ